MPRDLGPLRPAQAGAPERLERGRAGGPGGAGVRGPDPERDGVAAWTRADLCGWLEARFGKRFHPSSLSRVLERLDLSRQKTRPVHPEADPKAQERFAKRGCATP
jgi:transposase